MKWRHHLKDLRNQLTAPETLCAKNAFVSLTQETGATKMYVKNVPSQPGGVTRVEKKLQTEDLCAANAPAKE